MNFCAVCVCLHRAAAALFCVFCFNLIREICALYAHIQCDDKFEDLHSLHRDQPNGTKKSGSASLCNSNGQSMHIVSILTYCWAPLVAVLIIIKRTSTSHLGARRCCARCFFHLFVLGNIVNLKQR